MPQTTAKPTYYRQGEIDQAARDACSAHDLGREDEQRHRHERKDVQLGENALWQDRQELDFIDGNKSQDGDSAHQIGKGRAADQQQNKDDGDKPHITPPCSVAAIWKPFLQSKQVDGSR